MKKKIIDTVTNSFDSAITKTHHKFPFDKLSPKDFSELCYWLADDSDEFFDVEYYEGRDDKGRDVVAKRKEDKQNIEKCYFQCKRHKKISCSIFKKEVDKIKRHSDEKEDFKPDVITFVVACCVSPTIKDKTKKYARSKGFMKVFFWTEVELDKKVWDCPNCLRKFFDIEKNIKGLIDSMITQVQPEREKITFEFALQKCPILPNEFIPMTKWISRIDNSFRNVPFLYLYGIPKGSKTSIAAEYINHKNTPNYIWFEFKGVNNEFLFLLRDVAHFIDIYLKDRKLRAQRFVYKHISAEKVIQDFIDMIKSLDHFFLVLDNIHYAKEKDPLNSFLNILLKKSGNNVRVILISENKAGFESSPWWTNSILLNIQGFDPDEIKQFFIKENINISGFNENVFQLIHSHTCGHPFLVRSLIEQTKSKKVKPVIGIINRILKPLKLSKEEKKLSEHLQSKIYDSLLTEKDEKTLFNRLSMLDISFSQELSDEIAKINPSISSPRFVFNSLKRKILEPRTDNTFEIPKLFRKIGEASISPDEKRVIFKTTGYFLIKPNEGIVLFMDALWGYWFLLLAEEYESALRGFSFLITQIIYHNKKEFLSYVLDFCGFLKLHKQPINNDLLLSFYSIIGTAYFQLQKYREIERVIANIEKIPKISEKTDANLLFNLLAFQYYGFCNFEARKLLRSTRNILKTSTYFKTKLQSRNATRNLLRTVAYNTALNAASGGIYILKSLLELAINNKVSFDDFLYPEYNGLGFFEILTTNLFRGFYANFHSNKQSLNAVIEELKDILSLFETCKYTKGRVSITHLIGSLQVCFGGDQTDARKYLGSTLKYLNESELSKEKKETIKIHVSIDFGDSFYLDKKFDDAGMHFTEIVRRKKVPTSWDFLYFHSLKRLGICHFHLGNYQNAKSTFEQALKHSLKHHNKYNEFGLQVIGGLTIFFAKLKNYNKAVQCLALILQYLKHIPGEKYRTLSAHIIMWLMAILNKNKADEDLQYLPKVETLIEPDFEFYSRYYQNLAGYEFKGSLPDLQYMVGKCFELIANDSKAIMWYEKTLLSTDSDKGTSFLASFRLSQLYIKSKDYSNAIKKGIYMLELKANRLLLKHFMTNTFYHIDNVLYYIFIPSTKKLIKKTGNKTEFSDIEEILLHFVVLTESSEIEEKEKVLSFAYSALGAFYLINDKTDKGNDWWLKGYNLAKKIKYTYMVIQNEIWWDFSFTKSIRNLPKFFINNCKTLIAIIDGMPDTENFTKYYPQKFSNFWMIISMPKSSKVSESDQKLLNTLKNNLIEYQKVLNTKDAFLATCYFCIEGLSAIGVDELCVKISEYFLRNDVHLFSDKLPDLIELYFRKKKKAIVSQLNKNANNIIERSKEAITVLTSFLKLNQKLVMPLISRVKEMLGEFRVLAGESLK
jgi:tetratricopeptide (TPR) repeat protein